MRDEFLVDPHPGAILLIPAAPFLYAFGALDMDFDLSLYLSGAAGYGVLPLLAWGLALGASSSSLLPAFMP